MHDSVWAVVVARVGHGPKSRLAAALDTLERSHLALAMLEDVLETCHRSDSLAGTIAVVDEPAARAVAKRHGAIALEDPRTGDMNAAVTHGIDGAVLRGASTVIVLPGDIPLVTNDDIALLIQAARDASRAVIVGASRDGQGTNALLLRPPTVIAPSFGPPSIGRHLAAGLNARAETRLKTDLGLALDVDTPADLDDLADLPVKRHTADALSELNRTSAAAT